MHRPPVTFLLAEHGGGADVQLQRNTLPGQAAGALDADQQAHLGRFHVPAVIGHQGSRKSHGGFLGELLHHGLPYVAEGTGWTTVADVVGVRPDL